MKNSPKPGISINFFSPTIYSIYQNIYDLNINSLLPLRLRGRRKRELLPAGRE